MGKKRNQPDGQVIIHDVQNIGGSFNLLIEEPEGGIKTLEGLEEDDLYEIHEQGVVLVPGQEGQGHKIYEVVDPQTAENPRKGVESFGKVFEALDCDLSLES